MQAFFVRSRPKRRSQGSSGDRKCLWQCCTNRCSFSKNRITTVLSTCIRSYVCWVIISRLLPLCVSEPLAKLEIEPPYPRCKRRVIASERRVFLDKCCNKFIREVSTSWSSVPFVERRLLNQLLAKLLSDNSLINVMKGCAVRDYARYDWSKRHNGRQ